MKLPMVFLFSLLASACAFGQQSPLANHYEQKTIFLYGSRYILDGEKLRYRDLESYLRSFEPSDIEYRLSKKYSSQAGVLALVMLGSYIAAITQYGKHDNLAVGLTITGFAANLIAIPISANGKKHLQKSVWFYNRDVLQNR